MSDAKRAKQRYLVTIGLMFLCVLLWASGYVAYKEALKHYNPVVGSFVRQSVGFILFMIVFGRWAVRQVGSIKPVHWKQYGFISLCEPCLYYIFISYGMKLTTAPQTGIITSCVPVVVALMAWLVLREKPGKYLAVGTGIVLAGIVLMNMYAAPTEHAANPIAGNALLLVGCVCSAGYMVGLKKFDLPYPPLFSAIFQAAVGAVFFAFGLLLPTTVLPDSFPVIPTFCLVYTGFSNTFGVYALFNYCIPRMPIGQLTTFIYLVPVFTIVLSNVLTDEAVTLIQIVSCVLILLGVALSQKKVKTN